MRQVLILSSLVFISTWAVAGESVIVLQDNTTIRTRSGHEQPKYLPQFEVEYDESPDIKDPVGDAECFDEAKKHANRRDRFARLERCLG